MKTLKFLLPFFLLIFCQTAQAYSVKVRVLDEETKQPVAGVALEAFLEHATTAEDGTANLYFGDPGERQITASHGDYQKAVVKVSLRKGAEKEDYGVEVLLKRKPFSGKVIVTVSREDTKMPIPEVRIGIDNKEGRWSEVYIGSTNGQGQAVFYVREPGSYFIETDHSFYEKQVQEFSIQKGGDKQEYPIPLVLKPKPGKQTNDDERTLSIFVAEKTVDGEKKPVPNATVTLSDGQVLVTDVSGKTETSHHFAIGELITFSVQAKDYVDSAATFTAGGERHLVNLADKVTILMEKVKEKLSAKLVVTVLEAQEKRPLDGVHVTLKKASPDGTPERQELPLTDSEGQSAAPFALDPAAAYTVEASKPGFQDKWSDIPTELLQPAETSRVFTLYLDSKNVLLELLSQMNALEAQALAASASLMSAGSEFKNQADEASAAFAEAQGLANTAEAGLAEFKNKADKTVTDIAQIQMNVSQANSAGEAATQAYQAAENHKIKACEAAKSMKGLKDPKDLQALLDKAHLEHEDFLKEQSHYEKELENARSEQDSAKKSMTSLKAAISETKKQAADAPKLQEAFDGGKAKMARALETSQNVVPEAAALKTVKEQSLGLLAQARQLLSAIQDLQVREENEKTFSQMEAIQQKLEGILTSTKETEVTMSMEYGNLVRQSKSLEEKIQRIIQEIKDLLPLLPDEAALATIEKQVLDAESAYEAASIFTAKMTALAAACTGCVQDADELGKKKKLSGPDKLDCSKQPGTQPRIKESGEWYCGCLSGMEWNVAQNKCIMAIPAGLNPCFHLPGSVLTRDPVTQKEACSCPENYEWNKTHTGCRFSKAVLFQAANCGRLAGSTPVWQEANESVFCQCPQGYVVNADSTVCVASSQTQVVQTNCSNYPGTVPVWDAYAKQPRCVCPSGLQWNGASCSQAQTAQPFQGFNLPQPMANPAGNAGQSAGAPSGQQTQGQPATAPAAQTANTQQPQVPPGETVCPDGSISFMGVCGERGPSAP